MLTRPFVDTVINRMSADPDFTALLLEELGRVLPRHATLTPNTHEQLIALQHVLAERGRQDAKFGAGRHIEPILYCGILTEEVGEFAQAAVDLHYGGDKADGLLTEAIQVAAVAIAIVEMLLREGYAP